MGSSEWIYSGKIPVLCILGKLFAFNLFLVLHISLKQFAFLIQI